MPILLGCIADDFTGGTDLALTLVREGMRTVQVIGVPASDVHLPDADAIVVSLKSRTCPPMDAVNQSRACADALLAAGARQLFFKYCSTFDSTDQGNIGPVIEHLSESLGTGLTLACPSFPENGRTVYLGHLFVDSVPLAESPLKDHPLTPMRDSNLVRVLQRQTRLPVGLVPFAVVDEGPQAISAAFDAAQSAGNGVVIIDAVTPRHLRDIGAAAKDMMLVTGGSGVAVGLPENFRRADLMPADAGTTDFDAPAGGRAILSGSCSAATRAQLRRAIEAGLPALPVDPLSLAAGTTSAADIVDWARSQSKDSAVIIYSSADPAVVAGVQETLGRDAAGALVEETMAAVAAALVQEGVRRLIVAGGETSGAVVAGLGVSALRIGPEIDPGVPWTLSFGDSPLALALKSGNFGAPDFFVKAWDVLP